MRGFKTFLAIGLVTGGALAGAFCLAPSTAAQEGTTVDPALYGGMHWRSVGPARGGRSIAAAGSDSRPNEYWFGATGGGAWKTTDGGTTWAAMTDGKITMSSIGSIGVCEANPDVVYIGGGEADIRGNIMMGDGAYKTTDGGKTWAPVGLRDSQVIAKLRVHPASCDTVLAAVMGHGFGPSDERGVYKTTDGGKTWKRTLFRDNKTGAVELVYDPKNPNVVLTALWEFQRFPWGMSSGGPGSGLFKSTDGGETWREITKNPGLPGGLWGKVGISVSGANDNRVYALIENEPDGGLYLSDDAGSTWKKVNDNRNIRQRGFYYTRVYADPKVKDTVWILNVSIYKSVDAGKTLTSVRVPHGDNHDLWIAPTDSNRMIESNDGGANVSVNGGQTWTDQDYPTAQFYHVFLTSHIPYQICGAQQDNSTACMSSQTAGSGQQDAYYYAVGGGESGYIAPDPLDADVYYAGSYGGLLTRYDRRTGQQRNVNVWPDNPMGYGSDGITERFQWTFPIIFSPIDKKTIFTSSQHVWKTTNGGQSWERISPDLTRHDPKTMGASGGPITKDNTGVETYGVIFSIAPSHQDVNTIWTGSDDGLIHVTRDAGKTWENVTPGDLPDFARISLIEASPHTNGAAYASANRYQMGDQKPYVYKTTDFGKTWTKIVNGIKETHFARQLREDPKRQGLLYLGTENGVYVSFNDGANWQPLQLDLPDTSVQGVQVADRDLVIATHGRGFWILDNIGVLRQATPRVTSEKLHLFDPIDPLRGLDRNVAIDYYLNADCDTVKIEFLDARGQLVRSFTGDAKAAVAPMPASGAEDDEGGSRRPAPRIGVKKGMNRFTWDLRYEGATVFPGVVMWAAQPQRGPAAPPAAYTVRVTANGDTQSQDFVVGVDTRLKDSVTVADLQEQFALSLAVRDKVTAANLAVIQVRAIRDQVFKAMAKVPVKKKVEVQALADGLMKPITAVEEEVYQVKNRSGQDPLNYPIKLNNKIAALAGVVESADNKPTDQSYAVFKELTAKLDAQLQKLDKTVKTELPRLNAALKREKIDAVDPNRK